MATIRQRGKYWEAQIRRKGWPLLSRSFTTKTDARSWATVTEAEMERGVYVDRSEAEKNTLGDLLQRYLAEQMVPLRIRLRHHGSLLSTRRGFVSQPSIAVGVQRTLLYRSRPKLTAPGL